MSPKSLVLIEDLELYQKLKNLYKNSKIVKVFCDDILNFDFEKIKNKKFNSIWKPSTTFLHKY